MDLPFSDENFGNTDKVVVNIGWMDWEAWLRDDDRAILSLMQEFQCLHHLYLREPAHRAKSLDDVLTAKLRKIQPGNDIYIGISELGFPKIISACQGSLLVVGMPAIKAVEHFESEDLLELVSSMQKASADEVIDNGGCFVCLKRGDVLAVPSFWILAHDALEEDTITLGSVCATKRRLEVDFDNFNINDFVVKIDVLKEDVEYRHVSSHAAKLWSKICKGCKQDIPEIPREPSKGIAGAFNKEDKILLAKRFGWQTFDKESENIEMKESIHQQKETVKDNESIKQVQEQTTSGMNEAEKESNVQKDGAIELNVSVSLFLLCIAYKRLHEQESEKPEEERLGGDEYFRALIWILEDIKDEEALQALEDDDEFEEIEVEDEDTPMADTAEQHQNWIALNVFNGRQALATALQSNKTVVDINLTRNNYCGDEGAKELAEMLKTNRTITVLNLEYCGIRVEGIKALATALKCGGLGSKELAEMLKINRTIRHLNLEQCGIGVEGIKALATALQSNKTVVDISLAQNGCGELGSKELAEMLKINRTIRHLNLEYCGIRVEGIKTLATAWKLNDTVVDINLADNECGNEGAEAMAAVLSTNAAIKRLNLEKCRIGDAGVEALASALQINRVLTHLRMHGNDVGVQGAQALASAPMVNRVVAADWNQDDTLPANQLCRSPFGASTRLQALADALRMNQTITKLPLNNRKIGDDDLKALADALSINKTIKELLLSYNQIGDNGMKVLADALRVNKTLTHLNLFCNQLGDGGMKVLADALCVNKTLTHLNLYGNPIGDEGVKALAAALEANKTITEVVLSVDALNQLAFIDQLTDEGMQARNRTRAPS
eukprot:symbB.v1.2.035759.t2/scaffold4892.1/size33355/2